MVEARKTYELFDLRDVKDSERIPMTRAQSEVFIKATFLDVQVKDPYTEADAAMLGTLGLILWKRTQFPKAFPISKGLAVFALSISDRPGLIVLWAFTFYRMWKNLQRMVTIEDFVAEFPWGIPSMRDFERIWEAQKAYSHGEKSSRNLIDDAVNWG